MVPDELVPDDLVELGVVRGAYGIRGWVRIAPLAPDGAVLESVRRWWLIRTPAPQMLIIEETRRHGPSIVAKWQQCDSKEAADALKGESLAVARGDFPPLPPGEHYAVDIVGLRVVNRDGDELGSVSGLRDSNPGQGNVLQWLEVSSERATGSRRGQEVQTLLIPLNEQYVDAIDTIARLVRVDWHRDW